MKFFYLTLFLIFLISFPVIGKGQDEYFEDRKMIRETGHINGEKCLHGTSEILRESMRWDQQNPYSTAVLVTIWNDDIELDVVAAIDAALGKLKFTKISDSIYDLSNSSWLCFLKLYWEYNTTHWEEQENPKVSALFVPYFKKETDLGNEELSQEYIPNELEKVLNEELSIRSLLNGSVRIYRRVWLVDSNIRRFPDNMPARGSSVQ